MFNRGMTRSIIFLLVILLVVCLMMAPMEDGFLGQPKRNKEQCNQDCQNAIKKAQNELKRDLKKAKKLDATMTTKPVSTTNTTITTKKRHYKTITSYKIWSTIFVPGT